MRHLLILLPLVPTIGCSDLLESASSDKVGTYTEELTLSHNGKVIARHGDEMNWAYFHTGSRFGPTFSAQGDIGRCSECEPFFGDGASISVDWSAPATGPHVGHLACDGSDYRRAPVRIGIEFGDISIDSRFSTHAGFSDDSPQSPGVACDLDIVEVGDIGELIEVDFTATLPLRDVDGVSPTLEQFTGHMRIVRHPDNDSPHV